MGDENKAETEYQQLERELQRFYQLRAPYLRKFEKRVNVLRDRGTLDDVPVYIHVIHEILMDLLNRVEALEALTSVLRSEE